MEARLPLGYTFVLKSYWRVCIAYNKYSVHCTVYMQGLPSVALLQKLTKALYYRKTTCHLLQLYTRCSFRELEILF